jgi:hypothetical protein
VLKSRGSQSTEPTMSAMGVERRRPSPARPLCRRQSLAHHLRLRQLAPARLGFDLGDQGFRQSNCQCLHEIDVLHCRHMRSAFTQIPARSSDNNQAVPATTKTMCDAAGDWHGPLLDGRN